MFSSAAAVSFELSTVWLSKFLASVVTLQMLSSTRFAAAMRVLNYMPLSHLQNATASSKIVILSKASNYAQPDNSNSANQVFHSQSLYSSCVCV